ncbi:LPS assembly lipoprotein LptE [Bartonella machadoae]|uniref:LPS assembly lipoprotein LptE n=1 Tax=Bartonella machadoae TaxID=2893471 RepID=UPI001F4C8BB7|nr:LPS assembly lipoprotein LptE [Bartonella machadoae]UNE54062.1 LPS assembly lipoprotein LptE [Bartonella machadoae]
MSLFRKFLFVGLAGFLTLLCGCKIEPLYQQGSQISTTMGSVNSVFDDSSAKQRSLSLSEKLASIIVAEPSDRFSQMVRNHLLFLLYGNGGKPLTPAYQLALKTSTFTRDSVEIEVNYDRKRERRPSVGTVMGKVSYVLRDMQDVLLTESTVSMSASFERLRQEYATLQAEEDAQRRVAEELAEEILLMLSKDLANH